MNEITKTLKGIEIKNQDTEWFFSVKIWEEILKRGFGHAEVDIFCSPEYNYPESPNIFSWFTKEEEGAYRVNWLITGKVGVVIEDGTLLIMGLLRNSDYSPGSVIRLKYPVMDTAVSKEATFATM